MGIAVTSVDDTNGTWQYSTDGGTAWTDFGTVNNNNVVTLGATSIYNGFDTPDHGPDDQGYLAAASVILGTPPTPVITETEQTVGVTVDTTANKDIYAGYSNHTLDLAGNFSPVDALPGTPDFPTLDSTVGYTLFFNAQVVSEVVEPGRPRAGFSIIVVSQDTSKAVELAFQEGQIFAQTLQDFGPPLNNQFVASTTDVVTFDTTKEVQYSLAVQGNSYTLSANGTAILTGTLQDYTAGNTNGAPNPYTTSNFIFLGDNTTSARGEFRLNQIALETPTQVRFVPDADYAGDATLNFRAWDTTNSSANGETGVDASQTGGTKAFSATEATATITVNTVNDAPTLANLNGDNATRSVGQAATLIDAGSDSVVTDIDSADFDGGTLTVAITSNLVAAEDLLTLDTSGNIALSGTTAGSTVEIAGTVVGTLANALTEGADLVINLTDQATPSNLPSLLRAIQYQNTETTTPTTTARAIQVTLTDGDGGTSTVNTATITVTEAVRTVTLSVSAASGTEAGATAITVSATADASVTGNQTINLDVAGTNLTAGDYTLSTPTITILDGQTTGTATFTVIDDALVEGLETATLSLSNPSAGLTLGGVSSQTIAIEDNDRSANPVFTFAQFAQFQAVDNGQLAPSESAAIGLESWGLQLAELFDETYYLAQNPDIAAAVAQGGFATGYDHFVQFGINEGRNPSTYFDEAFYRANNTDVAAAIDNGSLSSGLMHYLSFGHWENRDPSALFDASDYLLNNPDISTAVASGIFTSGFEHFIEFGDDEGRLSTLLFEEAFYQQQNADVAAAVQAGVFSSGFEHFISFGQQEGRAPSSFFNESTYLNGNSDVAVAVQAGAFSSGFEHYALFGRAEGRVAV